MKSAEEQLTEVWHGVSSDIYAKAREKSGAAAGGAGPGPQPGPQPGPEAGPEAKKSGGKEGDVVDADFEMVDDDKKKP
jgi:molecular chaperone DnaK